MINTRKIRDLPQNLPEFVDQLGYALRNLYGPDAETAYKRNAPSGYAELLQRPEVRLWAAGGQAPDALLATVLRNGIGHITLLHVLRHAEGAGLEPVLINAAVHDLRARGARAVIGEFVRHRPFQLDSAFQNLAFQHFQRRLMMADLTDPRLVPDEPNATAPCSVAPTAARVLVDAYQGHPSRPLHPEAHDEAAAIAFIEAVRTGGYGETSPGFNRVYPTTRPCKGVIVGAEAAPGVAFILHIAVARAAQGSGIGAQLIRETADQFRRAGYARIGLGVTCGNPAERLYERLGFKPLAPVETYVWWSPQSAQPTW